MYFYGIIWNEKIAQEYKIIHEMKNIITLFTKLGITKTVLLLAVAIIVVLVNSHTPKTEAAGEINVYYSVGQNTTDHKTGSPTLTISSGVGTFSVAQTATNMGVGDKVTFNTSSSCFISSKTSTTVWNLITATGAACGDVTGATVNSIAHAFSSLSAAVGGASPGAAGASFLNTANLTTGNHILNIPLYYDSGSDTSGVNITAFTTGVNNYINIYTPRNTSTEVNQSQRHSGVWDGVKYNLTITDATAFQFTTNYIRIDGLQAYVVSPTGARSILLVNSGVAVGNDIRISNNILRGHSDATYTENAITSFDADAILRIWNNMIYDIPTTGSTNNRVMSLSVSTAYIYNNTIYGGTQGIRQTGGTVILKNNIVQAATDGYVGTFDASSDYNISDVVSDTTGISASYRSGLATVPTFTNVGTRNLHLDSGDTGAKDQGVVLKTSGDDANLFFTTDYENNTRPDSLWDIGADEYVVLDVTAPTLSEVTPITTPTNDTTPAYTFNSSEAGSVTYGGSCDSDDVIATSGNNTITFDTLLVGTYSDCTIIVTDGSNNASSPLAVTSFTVDDDVLPTITNVSSNKADGTYGEGEVIDIDLTFSELVTSTGLVTVTLETGTVDRTCTFTVSSSTTATCNYTVLDGDASSDLNVKTISGVINDASANSLTDYIPDTNLEVNKALVINTDDVIYYVNNVDGDDGDTGTTLNTAWATIGKANSVLKAGDTVYVSTGTFEELINPTFTGYENAFITYAALPGETPVIRQVTLSNKSYIKVIGFEITHNSTVYNHGVTLNGSSYIHLLNNNIHHTYGQGIRNSSGGDPISNITIRGNTIAWTGCPSGVADECVGAGGIVLTYDSHNLIEYNDISHTSDFIYTTGGYNVIRNNYFHDFANEDFPDGDGDASHVDIWQAYDSAGNPFIRNIFENNWAEDNVEINSHFNQVRDEDSSGQADAVVRGNVALRIGSYFQQWGGVDYARIYNNTFSDGGYAYADISKSSAAITFSNENGGVDVSTNGYVFNNILYKSAKSTSIDIVAVASGSDATISNNACEVGTDPGCSITSNINFVDYDNDVLYLQSNSNALNAGRAIDTVTSASGSGTSFTVNDAGLFVGGTSVKDAMSEEVFDTIIVGSNSAVKITNIDTGTDTVTVASSISWNNGDGIVLHHQGSNPDIGAFEYVVDNTFDDSIANPYVLSSGVVRLAATITNPENVRFVEFYVNNVPVGADATYPYTFNWSSGNEVVEYQITAKAYSLHASKILSDSSSVVYTYGDDETFSIGGTISGLTGTVILQNNTSDDLSRSVDGSFTFTTELNDSTSYAVTVLTQPSGQTCIVTNGSGTVSTSNVTNVSVACTTNSSSGGGSSRPAPTQTPTIPSSNSTDLAFTNIKLVFEGPTYYVINDGSRYGVTNPGILFSYGLEFSDGIPATTADNQIPYIDNLKPGDGALVKKPNDSTIYLVFDNSKHGFTSESVFNALGYSFSNVLEVTVNELDSLPIGTVLVNPEMAHPNGTFINQDGTIFRISLNQKFGIPNMDVYNSYNNDNDFSRVVPANAQDRLLPLGQVLDQRLVK